MLAEFLLSQRDVILARIRERVALRTNPEPNEMQLANGIPVFLDQLGEALRRARWSDVIDHEKIRESAGRHGRDLLHLGLSIEQVVHTYGDVCQVITQLAVERKAPISAAQFRTLNLCLDDAIADAVTAYAHQSKLAITEENTERLGALAHELRNVVDTAMVAFEVMRQGLVTSRGSTGVLLSRSLMDLRNLIDRSLAEVRLDAGVERFGQLLVADFIRDIEVGASIQAQAGGIQLAVAYVDRSVTVEADWHILAGAVSHLLQNAFKFTASPGQVSLTALGSGGPVRGPAPGQGRGDAPSPRATRGRGKRSRALHLSQGRQGARRGAAGARSAGQRVRRDHGSAPHTDAAAFFHGGNEVRGRVIGGRGRSVTALGRAPLAS